MPDFVPGVNDPSPVTRLLLFGFYDGATDGVMQLGEGGPEYHFDWTDENLAGDINRRYRLRPLPAGSLDQLAAVVGEHIKPNWPVWLPQWQFPTVEIRAEVDARIDAVLRQAQEPTWHITTEDLISFRSVVAEPRLAMAHAGRLGKYGA
jgi:hypothetical protein